MILMLIRIMNATAVHPRIGVLIGTIRYIPVYVCIPV
jgi:hypothetical protein